MCIQCIIVYDHKSHTEAIHKLLNHSLHGKGFHLSHLSRVDNISYFCLCCKGCNLHMHSDRNYKKLHFQGIFLSQVIGLTCRKATIRVCLPYLLHLLLHIKFFAAKEHLITESDACCIGASESQYCWAQDGIIHVFHVFKYLWNTLQHSIPVLLSHMTDCPFCGCSTPWAGLCQNALL